MTWNDMSPEAIELAFNPRATARNVDERVAGYAAASAETRARLDCTLDVRYGPGDKETLDIFPAGAPNAPVHLFIHGGYWRAMDKSDYSFIADVFQPAGATTVLINYDLCPDVTLDTIVAQTMRAIAWTWRNIGEHGGDPDRLYVSGNSAGGHLTAMALAHDWTAEDLPADIIKGAVPITGVHDCEPVPDITVNELVRLDRETARRLSPLRNPPRHALSRPRCGGRGGAAAVDRDVEGLRGALPRARPRLRVHGGARPRPLRREPGRRRRREPARAGDASHDGAVAPRIRRRVSVGGDTMRAARQSGCAGRARCPNALLHDTYGGREHRPRANEYARSRKPLAQWSAHSGAGVAMCHREHDPNRGRVQDAEG